MRPTPYSQNTRNSQAQEDYSNIPLPPLENNQIIENIAATGNRLYLEDIPMIPLPPIVGAPSLPDINVPVKPLPPIVGDPDINLPQARFCKVRFLHAAPNTPAVNISIGAKRVTSNLAYGNFSEYTYVPDGFRTVTILSTRSPRSMLLQHNHPFQSDGIITLAIINTVNGIELSQINDKTCSNRPNGMSCLRMSNLIYNGTPLDLLLSDCRAIFSDVRSRETTAFSRIRQGNYGFYVTQTPNYPVPHMTEDIEVLREMPVAVSERYVPGYGDLSPLLSFQLAIRPNTMYTIYVLGTMDSPSDIQMLIAENY